MMQKFIKPEEVENIQYTCDCCGEVVTLTGVAVADGYTPGDFHHCAAKSPAPVFTFRGIALKAMEAPQDAQDAPKADAPDTEAINWLDVLEAAQEAATTSRTVASAIGEMQSARDMNACVEYLGVVRSLWGLVISRTLPETQEENAML